MKESSSVHQKVQAMCDCYATNDPLKEMSRLQHEANTEEAAVKWIALAVLHGINNNAEQISIEQNQQGSIKVTARYRESELPPPDGAIAEEIISKVREIIHVDGPKGASTLAFGVRNNSMDLQVSARQEGGANQVTITFPG